MRRETKQSQEQDEEGPVAAGTTAILRLDLLRTYKLAWLPNDILAGLVIFFVTIPAALAYGQLAGLQPINGLYASLLAMGIYAFFGTSRQLIVGSEAPLAILVATSVTAAVAGGDAGRFALMATVEAIMVGGILVAAGVVRIGFIADFIPKSVVLGFLNGMALIIILALAGKICGIELTQTDFFPRLWEFSTKVHEIHRITLMVGGGCLLGLFLFRFIPKVPEAVLMVVLATAAAFWWNLGEHGIKLIGLVPSGLPHPDLPMIGFADVVNMLPIAIGVALVAFVDNTITGRAFAMKGGYLLDHNQELIALGLANVGTGLCHGFAVGSSHSRTAVNDMYGGRSQFAGLIAAGLLAVFMLRYTHILKNVPLVALAAIIVAAGIRLFNVREIVRTWRTRPASAYISIATTALVLICGLMTGILVAVVFSIILVLHRLVRPHETILRPKVPGSGLLVYRFAGPLFFFNAAYFADRIQEIVEAAEPPVKFLLVNAEAIVDMDINAVEVLEDLHHHLKKRNVLLGFCEVKGHFREVLLNTHLTRRTGFNLYHSVATVVQELTKGKPEKNIKSVSEKTVDQEG